MKPLSTPAGDPQESALQELNMLLQFKLLEFSIPDEISEAKVINGALLFRVDGEFEVHVTPVDIEYLSLWEVLHFQWLIGEKSGPVKLEEWQVRAIGNDLEWKMAEAEEPFIVLYSTLHELSVSLITTTVIEQITTLRERRWEDAITFGPVFDSVPYLVGLEKYGLKIWYWFDFDIDIEVSTPDCPFIIVEPKKSRQIKCQHSEFVIDPQTGREAELSLDPCRIDVEELLVKAVSSTRYTRLLEIHKNLVRNCQISQTANDIFLQWHGVKSDVKNEKESGTEEDGGNEVLCVRAYGLLYITLGINIENGRFLLRSSGNILPSSLFLEQEDALNHGSATAAEVFINLRRKSILRLFANIGGFLGLQVYEHDMVAVKIPKVILNGSDSLLMEFPRCGSLYYLLLELDKGFKPLFRLLDTRHSAVGESLSVIDIDQLQMLEDEVNPSLLELEDFFTRYLSFRGPPSHAMRSHQSSSSLFDEVFKLETAKSVGQAPKSEVYHSSSPSEHDSNPQRRSMSANLRQITSIEEKDVREAFCKRRRNISDPDTRFLSASQAVCSSAGMGKPKVYTYEKLLAEANKGNAPYGIYVTLLLNVVRHCTIRIKHTCLSKQLDDPDIQIVNEDGLGIYFRLLSAQEWDVICLRLGRPGSMSWDVKIDNRYYGALHELQNGSQNTLWGRNILVDSSSDWHIRCVPDGVVLSYRTLEPNCINKLVADLEKLSNAHSFAIRMLLDVEPYDDKMSKEALIRIEAVGLTTFCFSLTKADVYFVVKWASGKQGGTMKVSPKEASPYARLCDYFNRRVANYSFDAHKVASFMTLLTLPVSVIEEFLQLIAWKKRLLEAEVKQVAPGQKPRVELVLQNTDDNSEWESNIYYDRHHDLVDFTLVVVLDPVHMPNINSDFGARWLPYSVYVRLRYSFGEKPWVSFLGMEGSHGGRACWFQLEDWEATKQRVVKTVETHGNADVEVFHGRIRLVADCVRQNLHFSLLRLRYICGVIVSAATL